MLNEVQWEINVDVFSGYWLALILNSSFITYKQCFSECFIFFYESCIFLLTHIVTKLCILNFPVYSVLCVRERFRKSTIEIEQVRLSQCSVLSKRDDVLITEYFTTAENISPSVSLHGLLNDFQRGQDLWRKGCLLIQSLPSNGKHEQWDHLFLNVKVRYMSGRILAMKTLFPNIVDPPAKHCLH